MRTKLTGREIFASVFFFYTLILAIKVLVPETGVEPVRYRYRRILSPVRLPVPPLRHRKIHYINTFFDSQ